MNLSLFKLRKKLNTDKSGQSSLVGVILASVIGTVIVGSLTQWYISMNKTMSGTNDRLEAMTIAMSEWQRLEHMSLDELEANRENYKNPYDVGEKFKVGVTLGEQGFFDEGKCNSLTGTYAGENANCFKDTIMTVYDKDGNAMYTTRSLPLSVSRDSFPEGTILPYTGDLAKIPHGWVLCDGNNGTPDLRGRFLEGTGTTTGEFKSAGLPNIEGSLNIQNNSHGGSNGLSDDMPITSGAINAIAGYSRWSQDGDSFYYHLHGFNIDASLSNPIYGRSETVQPPSYTVFYIMKTNQDFHYNHTNPADTPSFYTKEEVDQLLEDERKNVANNYLNKSSKDYVRNLTNNYLLGLGYNGEDETLHGYVDGEDIPFASAGKNEIVEEWHSPDGSTWYRLYSDGWCEQGGTVRASGSYTIATVNFPKKFVLGYIPFATAKYINAPEYEYAQTGYTTVRFDFHTSAFITSLTNEQMKFGNGGQGGQTNVAYVWYACGVTQ